ncbi:MAG: hypothetical protein PQJ47_12325 [Sphaerochaetaceae bacterium]|nr:hypothetical protein [Sphaerochaetaceae bacterium]
MIDIRIHSSRHLEVKITYPITELRSYRRDINYYIFSPPQLNVSRALIRREAMLRKFQAHARYSSPEITFDELLDETNKISPLYLVEYYSKLLSDGSARVVDEIVIGEIQTLCNSFRHEGSRITGECKTSAGEDQYMLLSSWYRQTEHAVSRYRLAMENVRCRYPTGNKLCSAFLWGDEAISLLIENTALDLYRMVQNSPHFKKDNYLFLLTKAKEELNYRQSKQYQSGVTPFSTQSSENLIYRSAELKKWTQSVLYLNPIQSKKPERFTGILAGAAAAIAMTFATLTAIFAETLFLKNSMQWALLVIAAYVFKDRIKEGLRSFFNRVLPHLLADQIFYFNSPRTGRRLNKTKVVLRMTGADHLPPLIQRVREEGDNPFIDMMPQEDVVQYSRYVKVYRNKKSREVGPWINSMTVVIRLRIDDWLKEMDDSDDIFYYPSQESEIEAKQSAKVYHLHLVITESSGKNRIEDLHHVKLVLNKKGIVRLERIESAFSGEKNGEDH